MAIATSYADPAFGNDAGERLTVTFLLGNGIREDKIAALTRSRDSLNAVSGNPTRAKPGTE
jgi:hypothetical protein